MGLIQKSGLIVKRECTLTLILKISCKNVKKWEGIRVLHEPHSGKIANWDMANIVPFRQFFALNLHFNRCRYKFDCIRGWGLPFILSSKVRLVQIYWYLAKNNIIGRLCPLFGITFCAITDNSSIFGQFQERYPRAQQTRMSKQSNHKLGFDQVWEIQYFWAKNGRGPRSLFFG